MTVPVIQHSTTLSTARRYLEGVRGLTEPALWMWASRLPGPTGRLAGYHLGQLDKRGLVLVIDSVNSSNSVRLVELARRCGRPAHLIENASYIRPDRLERARTIGLTAGASAPPDLVHDTVAALAGLGPRTVREHTATTEHVRFALPSAVRRPTTDPAAGSTR